MPFFFFLAVGSPSSISSSSSSFTPPGGRGSGTGPGSAFSLVSSRFTKQSFRRVVAAESPPEACDWTYFIMQFQGYLFWRRQSLLRELRQLQMCRGQLPASLLNTHLLRGKQLLLLVQ
eukprot:1601051-Amphidinium_carterae.1